MDNARNRPVCAGTPYRNFFLFLNFIPALINIRGRGSSVSIVSGYWLDDRVVSSVEVTYFSSNFCVHTSSEGHPASCPMGTGVLSPSVKRELNVTLTTHTHPVPRSWMNRSYTSSPPPASPLVCYGTAFLFYLSICTMYIYLFPLHWRYIHVYRYF
jgi:hypothetical protein